MLLEPDRFRHTPPLAPERTHGPSRPSASAPRSEPAHAAERGPPRPEKQDEPKA